MKLNNQKTLHCIFLRTFFINEMWSQLLNAFIMNPQKPLESVSHWPTASEEECLANNHMIELSCGVSSPRGALRCLQLFPTSLAETS